MGAATIRSRAFAVWTGLLGSFVGCSSGGADALLAEDGTPGACKASYVFCDGRCIDPKTDARHCGATGNCEGRAAGALCTSGSVCIEGVCGTACGVGRVQCGGRCIDPRTDANYCGAAGDCVGANAGVVCRPSTGRCAAMMGAQCQEGQCVTDCPKGGQTFSVTGKVEKFKLPACVTEITVKAWGAQGGSSTSGSAGGLGAAVEGSVCIAPGSELTIVVGEQAPPAQYPCGGGGGSYVAIGTTPLFVAGGGGGGYYNYAPGGGATVLATMGNGVGGAGYKNAGGGGGFSADGKGVMGSGGTSFLGGAMAGKPAPMNGMYLSGGGFGGGGGASWTDTFEVGGGGGYDGGKAGLTNSSTGGSSYLSPSAVQTKFTPATRTGNGSVEISY